MVVSSRAAYVRLGGRVWVVRIRGNCAVGVVAVVRLSAWVLRASIRECLRLASSIATPLDPGKSLQHKREENWLEIAVSINFVFSPDPFSIQLYTSS